MSVLGISVVVQSTDRDAAVRRYESLLGAAAGQEFAIPGKGLTVSVFPGLSILSGATAALAPVSALRATVFVESLPETEAQLVRAGWTAVGSLGAGKSLLARDPDGTVMEFVERTSAGSAE
jgi:hypothetical protein